jgi:hypothetical protein
LAVSRNTTDVCWFVLNQTEQSHNSQSICKQRQQFKT